MGGKIAWTRYATHHKSLTIVGSKVLAQKRLAEQISESSSDSGTDDPAYKRKRSVKSSDSDDWSGRDSQDMLRLESSFYIQRLPWISTVGYLILVKP